MKKAQIIISAIIYFLSCLMVLNSAGIRQREIFQNIDFYAVAIIAIIFLPVIISLVVFFKNKIEKSASIWVLFISIFSLCLIALHSKFTNLRGLNESVTIVSTWRSGMPKELKYYAYSQKDHLVTISYHENGSMSKRTDYRNGLKSGPEISYNQNSSIRNIKDYVQGELVAEYDYDNADMKLKENLPKIFDDLKRENLSDIDTQVEQIAKSIAPCCPQDYVLAQYHENGRIKSRQKYVNNEVSGEWIEFYPNGQIKEQGIMRSFDKIGKWEYFNESGKLVNEELYDETGILIEEKKIN
jgi:antitoxin component YwqK of YwqJK toxin-antitoxin module